MIFHDHRNAIHSLHLPIHHLHGNGIARIASRETAREPPHVLAFEWVHASQPCERLTGNLTVVKASHQLRKLRVRTREQLRLDGGKPRIIRRTTTHAGTVVRCRRGKLHRHGHRKHRDGNDGYPRICRAKRAWGEHAKLSRNVGPALREGARDQFPLKGYAKREMRLAIPTAQA